ncbi:MULTISPECIES: DUF3558 family protein [Mycolicibacterium]|uniref:DUF3558 domain-containing protein n=3 Tax=Mycolicibacterium gilvum TaxID=1804 RepID=E6TFL0_MYCSR|nr:MULTISPECIES: DUF3558 family protein [Mycolicibacterium]ABP46501.1 conserved hypothetical protein [Mycolicibacterium gilvum PYR-GCK]ADT99986.1 hypothetical protein Mspyr1_33750 [Mycolicibacterium gilvum Spyr1]MBV5244623.1 DUF3558 family protein [Mycolicibacterium sp. PAM1]MCV7059081.1 DUF3558 family protein [Mycolicibacterium gilvum]STZ43005.1 Conserved exported protein of uncharacterised function [Mycolicibacterium gilvum]
MVAKLRLFSALCALVAAVVVVCQVNPAGLTTPAGVDLRSTFAPLPDATPPPYASTTIKSPVIDLTDPDPFNPCRDIPLDAVQRIGLAYTPPTQEDSLRCKYDAGNYQMAVETFVWRTYEESLPPDAVELDINGHRAAQFWIMKPTDWNNRWWITCMVAFQTSYGVIQQSLFYSPIYSEPDPDCMQTNLQRAHELSPYYIY